MPKDRGGGQTQDEQKRGKVNALSDKLKKENTSVGDNKEETGKYGWDRKNKIW